LYRTHATERHKISETTLLATESPARTSLVRPRRVARRCLRPSSKRRSVVPRLGRARVAAKPPLDKVRREDVIPPASKLRPYAREEVVQVSRQQTRDLNFGVLGTGGDECHQDQRVRKIFGLEVDDVEGNHRRRIVLAIRVCEREDEGVEEDVCSEVVATQNLFLLSVPVQQRTFKTDGHNEKYVGSPHHHKDTRSEQFSQ